MFNFKKRVVKKPSIFIVEDSNVFLQTLKLKLKAIYKSKVNIKGFTESTTFLEMLKEGVEVVIMDLYLDDQSKIDGLELLRNVKQTSPSTFVLVLTGEENFEIAKKCFSLGADSYMVKSPESIDAVVKEIHYKISLTSFN